MASIDRELSREVVVARAKARPGSYMSQLAERIGDCFLGSLVDLEKEYQDFYLREYGSFKEFLFWRYGVQESTSEALLSGHSEKRVVVKGNFSSGGDYMVDQLSYSDQGASLWKKLLDIDESNEGHRENEDFDED